MRSPVLKVLLVLCLLSNTGLVRAELLWNHSDWDEPDELFRQRGNEFNYESNEEAHYLLVGVCSPLAAWRIDEVSQWFMLTTAETSKITSARLHVISCADGMPGPKLNPRHGREVPVRAHQVTKGIFRVDASGLDITIPPGRHWIGLTPIVDDDQCFALQTGSPRKCAIDPIVISVGSPGSELAKSEDSPWWSHRSKWSSRNAVYQGGVPYNSTFTLRVKGKALLPGTVTTFLPAATGRNVRLRHGAISATEKDSLPVSTTNELFIVTLADMAGEAVHHDLVQLGASVLNFIPENAYLVRSGPQAIKKIEQLNDVAGVLPLNSKYKVDPSVEREDMRHRRRPPTSAFVVHVADNRQAKQRVTSWITTRGKVRHSSDSSHLILALLPPSDIAKLVKLDDVVYVERTYDRIGHANGFYEEGASSLMSLARIRSILGVNYVEESAGLRGAGVTVGITDSTPRPTHFALAGRIDLVGSHQTRRGSGHGTMVAGLLIGNDPSVPSARGMLPMGRVLALDDDFRHVSDRQERARELIDRGAVILSDSGASGRINHYDFECQELDELVWSTDIAYFRAQGNTAGNHGALGSWAKNVITVAGANHGFSDDYEMHTPWAPSGRGPALDGRVKPDLVCFSQDMVAASSVGESAYDAAAGTSAATPLAAGVAGNVVEMWAKGMLGRFPLGETIAHRKPHAATLKALMINSARQYSLDIFTRSNQGWGLPNVRSLHSSRDRLFVIDEEIPLKGATKVSFPLVVKGRSTQQLKATLVWTDPPAAGMSGLNLVNDLDLVLYSPSGKQYLGNAGLNGSLWSRPAQARDHVNNVEQVIVQTPEIGEWAVEVRAQRVAIDQFRDTAEFDNVFSLVVNGVAL